MAQLVWDASGDRVYQHGVSRGVLYLQDGTVVVWNGLTGMDEGSESELTSYYLDGVKYLQNLTPGEFSGKLKAFTYPDELEEALGVTEVVSGLLYHEQPPKSFSLSYQTRVANDLDAEAGYKIHLLYNLLAVPDDASYETLGGNSSDPVEFSWSLTGTPPQISGYRPTVHVVVDSLRTPADVLEVIENVLYGTDDSGPRFPTIGELRSLYETIGVLTIIDNGDGTWTAVDAGNQYITMDSPTQFTIAGADATMLDATTYTISTTTS
jgi:hypothetical protein